MITDREFKEQGPFWHLYTNGHEATVLFDSVEDFIFAMNIIPWVLQMCRQICLSKGEKFSLKILTFSIMSTHFHFIACGSVESCRLFMDVYLTKIARELKRKDVTMDVKKVYTEPLEISDITMMRSEIPYVNRNGFVANEDCTPYSYMWSSAPFYYNPVMTMLATIPYKSLHIRQKRAILHTKDTELPPEVLVLDPSCFKSKTTSSFSKTEPTYATSSLPATSSYSAISSYSMFHPVIHTLVPPVIHPATYCDIAMGESFFYNAHDYFNKLSRDVESYAAVSQRLGESVSMTYAEIKSAVYAICHKDFNCADPKMLTSDQRLILARRMHFDMHASDNLISKLLNLPLMTVRQLFPSINVKN